jgi:hypothetical protein
MADTWFILFSWHGSELCTALIVDDVTEKEALLLVESLRRAYANRPGRYEFQVVAQSQLQALELIRLRKLWKDIEPHFGGDPDWQQKPEIQRWLDVHEDTAKYAAAVQLSRGGSGESSKNESQAPLVGTKTEQGGGNAGVGSVSRIELPRADHRRLPNSTDTQAVTLPEAHDFHELYAMIIRVCEHLGAMTGEWWRKYHFKPSPPTPDIVVVIDPEGEAAWHRRRAAKEYRDQLRNQLLRLWQPGRPILPEQEANPEPDIRNKLTPWLMGVLSADPAMTSVPAGTTGQKEGGTTSEPHRLPTPAQLADLAGKLRKWAEEIDARGITESLRTAICRFLRKSVEESPIPAGWYTAAVRQDPNSDLCDLLKSSVGLLGRLAAKTQRPIDAAVVSKELRWLADQLDCLDDANQTQAKRFRVALSFPGEYRPFVAQVAEILADHLERRRVFYDKCYEAELARPNLDTYLQQIYHDDSELIAVFLCAEYEKKDWCGLEWRAIRDLIKKKDSATIMPFRFDATTIPGVFSIDGYVEVGKRSANDVASLILQRLEHNDQRRKRIGKQS